MVERYWVVYYLVYVVCAVFFLSQRWSLLFHGRTDYIHILSSIFGSSVGIALLFAIVAEVTGRMVLLIPQAVKKLINRGREEERAEQRSRMNEAYKRFGVEVDGVVMLPRTTEVVEFLNKNDDSGK